MTKRDLSGSRQSYDLATATIVPSQNVTEETTWMSQDPERIQAGYER